MAEIQCFECGNTMGVREEMFGNRTRCPACGNLLAVPHLVEAACPEAPADEADELEVLAACVLEAKASAPRNGAPPARRGRAVPSASWREKPTRAPARAAGGPKPALFGLATRQKLLTLAIWVFVALAGLAVGLLCAHLAFRGGSAAGAFASAAPQRPAAQPARTRAAPPPPPPDRADGGAAEPQPKPRSPRLPRDHGRKTIFDF